MKKDEILKILDIASYILIIVATFLVVLFEFVGSEIIMKIALAIYFVGLLALTALLCAKTYFEFSKKSGSEVVAEENDNPETVAKLKKRKRTLLIAELVFSAAALVFSLVILILY